MWIRKCDHRRDHSIFLDRIKRATDAARNAQTLFDDEMIDLAHSNAPLDLFAVENVRDLRTR